MPTASPEDQQRLLELQAFDTRYAGLVHAKRTHPTVTRIAELDTQLADLNTSLVASRTAVGDIQRELKKAEDDVAQVEARISKDRDRLESGALGHKDAVAVTEELASLNRRQGIVEETQLEVMERLDAHQDALTKVEAAYTELQASKDATLSERDAAWADLASQAKALVTQRQQAVSAIDPALVSVYDSIRKRLGSGAAALRAGRCSGCGIELNPTDLNAANNAPPTAIVHCEECGRILVRNAPAAASDD
ncbi:MAG: C4-type zinc ribbon domain-containing protein [Cellulomonadaceae bacterium]|nr:C4-type zinc ribbon domain-containing protein [Cellulomonadaceae bacterium]